MAQAGEAFREDYVEADGFRIRYMAAGEGPPLVHLHGAGGLRLTPGHDLLSRQFRVVAFEMPGFGASPENDRTRDMAGLATTMAKAADELGLDQFNLMGTSFGGKTALWLAVQQPERVRALVLEAPAAIRPKGSATALRIARGDGAPALRPSREGCAAAAVDPAVREKTARLVSRLRGPDRDADLETRLAGLAVPTLVLFGTVDRVIPPDMGHFYKELMPNCHLAFVYDAGHAISTDRPEAFTEIVGDFFERREAFVISRTATVIHP